MRFIQQWRSRIFAFIIISTLYILSYGYVRSQHLLVHYSTSAAGNTNSHRIRGGDFGLGFNPAYLVAGISYWAFMPLRQIETGFWYLRYPVGQPWPYEIETSQKRRDRHLLQHQTQQYPENATSYRRNRNF